MFFMMNIYRYMDLFFYSKRYFNFIMYIVWFSLYMNNSFFRNLNNFFYPCNIWIKFFFSCNYFFYFFNFYNFFMDFYLRHNFFDYFIDILRFRFNLNNFFNNLRLLLNIRNSLSGWLLNNLLNNFSNNCWLIYNFFYISRLIHYPFNYL